MIVKKVYKKISMVMIFIIFFGCSLEHNLLIDIKNNHYSVDYTQLRDIDLIPFLYPEDLNTWTKIDSNEIELHYKRDFNYSEKLLSLFTINSTDGISDVITDSVYTLIKQKEIILKEPYTIKKSNFFVLENYQFEGIFKGRRVKNNYDKLINYYSGFMDDAKSILDGDDIDDKKEKEIDVIFSQLIDFMYLESLAHIEWNQRNIYLNALTQWREDQNIKNTINENKIGIDGAQLNKVFNAAENFLYQVVEKSHINGVKSIWSNLKLEIYGTLFLLFNDFYIKVNMPKHNMIYHNADSVNGNTLMWNVDIEHFINEDYKIFASSRLIDKIKSGLVLLLIIIISVVLIRKKYSTS